MPHQLTHDRLRLQYRRFSTRGQDIRHGIETEQHVERFLQITRFVECTMEGDRQAIRRIDRTREAFAIDLTVCRQHADHYAVRTGRFDGTHVSQHHGVVVGVIHK